MIVKRFLRLVACVLAMSGAAFSANAQTILGTSNKSQQCQAANAWVEIARELGGAQVMTGNMVMQTERRRIAPAFADDIFEPHFGKRYFDLSGSDKRKIDQTLRRCSQNNRNYWYGTAGVSEAFQTRMDRYDVSGWQAEIQKHQAGAVALAEARVENDAEAERQRQAGIIRTTNKVWTVNRAGELLFDHPEYAIHAFKSHSHDFRPACDPNLNSFNASVIVKNQTQRLNFEYVERVVEEGLIPTLRSKCPSITGNVVAQFFFDGVQLDNIGRRFQTSSVSTTFDFIELPFVRVSTQANPPSGQRTIGISWFNNHRPTADVQPYYETLAGLQHIRRQEFRSDQEWAAVQQARADRAARLAQAEVDAVVLAGFNLNGGGGVGLITGVEPDTYFQSHSRDLVEAVMGYSTAIVDLCPSHKIPGGLTHVTYRTWSVRVDPYTREESERSGGTIQTFSWPADFYDLIERVVNVRDVDVSGWLANADRTVYYQDVHNMISLKGCGSDGLLRYHDNLRDVAYRVGGDWNDFTSVLSLLAAVFMSPQ